MKADDEDGSAPLEILLEERAAFVGDCGHGVVCLCCVGLAVLLDVQ